MAATKTARRVARRPRKLRGILPTPPVVRRLVARELKDHPVTPQERQRITDDFKMQYYFGGQDIAYRQTPKGMEVLAVDDEIGPLLRSVPPAERELIIIGWWDPW